jgi:hypothetical protein
VQELLVFSGPWKGHYVDRQGVVFRETAVGPTPHLLLVVNQTHGRASAYLSLDAPSDGLMAQRLQQVARGEGPCVVLARAALANRLRRALPGDDWQFQTPQRGGQKTTAVLVRQFTRLLTYSVAYAAVEHDGDDEFDALVGEAAGVDPDLAALEAVDISALPVPVEVVLVRDPRCHGSSLHDFNAVLAECSEWLFPGQGAFADSYVRARNLAAKLAARPVTAAASDARLELTAEGQLPLAALDGLVHFPTTVAEALALWALPERLANDVRRIPWPALREHLCMRSVLLREHYSSDVASALAAHFYGSADVQVVLSAFEAAEAHAVWSATAPRGAQLYNALERAAAGLREHDAAKSVFDLADGSSLDFAFAAYLELRYPLMDFGLASLPQLKLIYSTWSVLASRAAFDRAELTTAAITGISVATLRRVVAWGDDETRRGTDSFYPDALDMHNAAQQAHSLFPAQADAYGRRLSPWLPMSEFVPRVRQMTPWARTARPDKGVSVGLVAQACVDSDAWARVGPSEDHGYLVVHQVFCAEPHARKLVQTGWDIACVQAARQAERREVERAVGPLPVKSGWVLLESY